MPSYPTLTRFQPAGLWAAPGPDASAPGALQLADFLRLLRERKALIERVALGVIASAILIAFILPTQYASSAVVMLDPRKNNVTELSAVLSQLPSDPTGLQNQIQILTSRELAAQVIAKLKLYDDPEFNPAIKPPDLSDLVTEMAALLNPRNWFTTDETAGKGARGRDAVIDTFLKHLSVDSLGLSTAFTVTFTSHDPEKSAAIANALADAYVANQRDTKIDAAGDTAEWLTTRVHDLAQQIQIQEEAVQQYKAQHDLNDPADGNSIVDQQMVGINAQIVQARSDLAEKQATYDRVTSLVNAGDNADVSQVVTSQLIVQLRGQEADLIRQEGELSTTYGARHPKMLAVEAQKRDLDDKIAQEVTRIAGSISNDLLVARAHLASLEESLADSEHESTGQNMARVKLAALQSNAASTRTMYEAFVSRLREAQDQDAVQDPESHVISRAPIPLHPTSPKRMLIVAASVPTGLLLGLLAALMAERFGLGVPVRVQAAPRATLMRPPAARPTTRSVPRSAPLGGRPPILAEIEHASSLRAADYVIDWPKSHFSHEIAQLVRELESRPTAAGHPGAAVIAFTAAEPGESKSTIAVSLVRAAALAGRRSVLIDCDGQSHMAARAMRAPAEAGLFEVLSGAVPLGRALAKDPRTNAFVLASLRPAPNSTTMFASSQMAGLIAMLRQSCDLVVIDCANARSGPDAALIARLADATILVAQRWALGQPSLGHAVQILRAAQAAPVGIVVAG